MASITNERLYELLDIYNALKKRILQIDEKYSLDFVEPQLDMPESLNLTKLEYTPKTEKELKALAEQKVAATIISKQATLDKNYYTKIKNYANQLSKLQQEKARKLDLLLEDYENSVVELQKRLVNNGLIFSTIKTKYENELMEEYKSNSAKKTEEYDDEIKYVNQQQKDADAIYMGNCNNLEQEKVARIEQSYQKLVEEEEKLKRSIEKYNTGLDEKEQKYQASRAKAYESARRAAYTRAYNNSKLYMEMGETGYRRAIEKEKYAVSQDAFFTLRRDEANAILSMDSFLVTHLGTYYNSFEYWVNTTLPA